MKRPVRWRCFWDTLEWSPTGRARVIYPIARGAESLPAGRQAEQKPPGRPHRATHLVRWTRAKKFGSPAKFFSPFGKGGSRGICLSGVEAFCAAKQWFFGALKQREGKKSPLAPLCQRGVKKHRLVICRRRDFDVSPARPRVQPKLMGNDQGQGRGLSRRAGISACSLGNFFL